LGLALHLKGEYELAIRNYDAAIKINPRYSDAHYNLGNAYRAIGNVDEAILSFKAAISCSHAAYKSHFNLATIYQERGERELAIDHYKRSLQIKPDYAPAEARLTHQRQHLADFSVYCDLPGIAKRISPNVTGISCFGTLSWVDDPQYHFRRARQWSTDNYGAIERRPPASFKKNYDKIRVGYFSSDIHDHATMYLFSGVLREYNRELFEVHIFSYGNKKTGTMREAAIRHVDFFHDISALSDRDVLALAQKTRLDIAVDLKGYTQGARTNLFAYGLAPVQINYLGYPGTMGADFMDYIIADHIVIPPHNRSFISEKIIYLPDSYQPNDNLRLVPDKARGRAMHGLPESGIIFCCFNNSYKISSKEFDIWMSLLRQVPDSSIWLLMSNEYAKKNLLSEAKKRGISSTRLIFAQPVPHLDHLDRLRNADIFLDTFNYNAHTTASDALWVGTPAVTKLGQQFCARVAASLLSAVGLERLISRSEQEYFRTALKLAQDPSELNFAKNQLGSPGSLPLYDTKKYTRALEAGFKSSYSRYLEGLQPDHIFID
jgi:predicted O-linked N-acetylglucosamine transferase (SPINDLY family)